MDYSRKSHWAFLPKLKNETKDVDVFFVYPTVYAHPFRKKHHNMSMRNPFYLGIAKGVAAWQGQLFARHCNFYAPHYRQIGTESFKMPLPDLLRAERMPYADVCAAFHYYLEHYNNGRPFILAGHSQGSAMLLQLMRKEFTDPALQEKLIAAYLIGFSLTRRDLKRYPHIKLAEGETDIGSVISYNTTANGLPLMRFVRTDSICINPLNWERGSTYADKSLNDGAVLLQLGKRIKYEVHNYTGAYVDEQRGVLVIDDDAAFELYKARWIFKKFLMNRGSLHMLDIALFYKNLEHNVEKRIDAYFRKK
ncbi:MAG: DUF3089 domain-containing protein [Christensenella sp.]